MNAENENPRITDLRRWPTQALKRRLKLDQDMKEALSSVGVTTGEFCSNLRKDCIAIKRVLAESHN